MLHTLPSTLSARSCNTTIYQPTIEDIFEDKLIDLAKIQVGEATHAQKPLQSPKKQFQSSTQSEEGIHTDEETTGDKPLHSCFRKPLQTVKPRRNSSTGNLRDTGTISFDKQKYFLGKRSVSTPDIQLAENLLFRTQSNMTSQAGHCNFQTLRSVTFQ